MRVGAGLHHESESPSEPMIPIASGDVVAKAADLTAFTSIGILPLIEAVFVSVTVIVCSPAFVSFTPVKTCWLSSAVVNVKFAGRVAPLAESVKWTVPR